MEYRNNHRNVSKNSVWYEAVSPIIPTWLRQQIDASAWRPRALFKTCTMDFLVNTSSSTANSAIQAETRRDPQLRQAPLADRVKVSVTENFFHLKGGFINLASALALVELALVAFPRQEKQQEVFVIIEKIKELDDDQFFKYTRLTKCAFDKLLNIINHHQNITRRKTSYDTA
ncbi:hypothetical protein NQ315_003570, partial [Exocentrus adspersus]